MPVNLRWDRRHARSYQGRTAARRRRNRRRQGDRLYWIARNRQRLAEVACGRTGHLPVGWGDFPDVCEHCCKVFAPPAPFQRWRNRQQYRQQRRPRFRFVPRNPLERLARPERLEPPTF